MVAPAGISCVHVCERVRVFLPARSARAYGAVMVAPAEIISVHLCERVRVYAC